MLNRLRARVEGVVNEFAVYTSRLGLTPNSLTLISLLMALTGLILSYLFVSGVLLSICIVISGIADVLDGAVARLQGRETRRGAFLDSFIDRVSEALFAISFVLLGFNAYTVIALLASSNLVSYARARAESLGVKLDGVGLMERAERLIFLAFIAILADTIGALAHLLYTIAVVLTSLTAIQRFIYVWREL